MQQMQSPRLVAVGPIGSDMANAALLQGHYPFMGSAQQMQQVQQIFQGQGMPYPHGMQMNGKGHGGTGTRSGVCASRHMAAEQRRRARINERLEALRSLVPHSARANTAAFLEEVYDYISALHKQLERLGGGPFATPGPSPPTAMLDPPASKMANSGGAAGTQLTGNKRERSASEESDMQAGHQSLDEMTGNKSQFAPYLQAALLPGSLPGSPLFGASTSPMVIPELSLRSMMTEGLRPVAPVAPMQQALAPMQQQAMGQRVAGNGSMHHLLETGLQRMPSPVAEEQGLAPQAGDGKLLVVPGPSDEIAPEGDLLASPQQERELSAEVEFTEGAGTSQEEAAAEGEQAAPKKRAKKSGPTVEMCGMKARNVQGVHRPIPMKPQA
eukprot:TRINITY_DN18920_c0_g1_i1.p1 TRINITY_DN18920_c0_g1~~TRINITY_DN18920_c0_g1_i1.p1  ORF type:complete len:384 (+),score=85.98 TRINITY_DN18920_c0_g1_i1:235-1386(+)